MLYYNRIDLSEEIDVAKSNNTKECIIGILIIGLINITAMITVKGVDYCCIIYDISKSEAINLLKVVSATFLLVCFVSLNESTCQTRKNVFYFTSKALFVLEKIKF